MEEFNNFLAEAGKIVFPPYNDIKHYECELLCLQYWRNAILES